MTMTMTMKGENRYEKERNSKNKDYMEKVRVELIIDGVDGHVVGSLHKPTDIRVTDYLNETSKNFIPLVDVTVKGDITTERDLIIVSLDKISLINPL